MSLDYIVGGMPRGGTTVAAKFLSLNNDIFCYAGETHLIPFMHSLFGDLPCRHDKIELVGQFLKQQFMTAMVEMPKFSVSQGAHPGNDVFDEDDVNDLIGAVKNSLNEGLYGAELHKASLKILRDLLTRADHRRILGEKTPSNVFAMADYATKGFLTNVVVMREPFGVVRSMQARVKGGDAYSKPFQGTIEANIGVYLEYSKAAKKILDCSSNSLLIRYEDMAEDPCAVIDQMFRIFGRDVEECVANFVDGQWDVEVANRAPMNYKRLKVKTDYSDMPPVDLWKIAALTHSVRESFGYSDQEMNRMGIDVSTNWPGMDVPLKLFPLYGFNSAGMFKKLWMKKNAGMIIYLNQRKGHHEVLLRLASDFPDYDIGNVQLHILIGGDLIELVSVKTGKRVTEIVLDINSRHAIPMGKEGGCVIVEFESSLSHNELGHSSTGHDAIEKSFCLLDWSIDRKRSTWQSLRNRILRF